MSKSMRSVAVLATSLALSLCACGSDTSGGGAGGGASTSTTGTGGSTVNTGGGSTGGGATGGGTTTTTSMPSGGKATCKSVYNSGNGPWDATLPESEFVDGSDYQAYKSLNYCLCTQGSCSKECTQGFGNPNFCEGAPASAPCESCILTECFIEVDVCNAN